MNENTSRLMVLALSWIEIALGAALIAFAVWLHLSIDDPESDPHGFVTLAIFSFGGVGVIAMVAGALSRLGKIGLVVSQLLFFTALTFIVYWYFI